MTLAIHSDYKFRMFEKRHQHARYKKVPIAFIAGQQVNDSEVILESLVENLKKDGLLSDAEVFLSFFISSFNSKRKNYKRFQNDNFSDGIKILGQRIPRPRCEKMARLGYQRPCGPPVS